MHTENVVLQAQEIAREETRQKQNVTYCNPCNVLINMLLYAVILIKYSICLYINNGQLAIKQSLLQYKGEILYLATKMG